MPRLIKVNRLGGGKVEVEASQIKERVGVYAMLFDWQTKKRVLLVRMFNGKLTAPGGEKEPYETFEEALRREVTVEECGVPFSIMGQCGFCEGFVALPDLVEVGYHSTALFFYGVADGNRPLITRIQNHGHDDEYEVRPEWVDISCLTVDMFVNEAVYSQFRMAARKMFTTGVAW
jgi:ADP-ribose pyrophosphatase YjhB (NUDIX family)